MAGIVTNKFRLKNAKEFIAKAATDSYYAFIGRPMVWPADDEPVVPQGNIGDDILIWNDLMSLKKLSVANFSNGVIRRLWSSGKHYDIYRHDYAGVVHGVDLNGSQTTPASLADANYYVVDDSSGNIFVCIDNNLGGASTVDPQTSINDYNDTNNFTVTKADLYKWKLIAKTSASDASKFVTTDYHPVKTLTESVPEGDDYYAQWLIQEEARVNAGGIYHVVISNGGTGWTGTPTVAMEGDGTGWTGSVSISAGAITKVTVVTPGTGYTYGKVVFTGTGTNAEGTAIISPPKGLGADAVSDLCAMNVIVNFKFIDAEAVAGTGKFTQTNNYRRIGILVNPLTFNGLSTLTMAAASAMTELNLVSGAGFADDSIITNDTTTAKGVVVDVDGGSLRIIRTSVENSSNQGAYDFVVGNTVSGGTAPTTIISIVDPDVQKHSGEIIYYENRRPITRSIDQTEEVKVVFEF